VGAAGIVTLCLVSLVIGAVVALMGVAVGSGRRNG